MNKNRQALILSGSWLVVFGLIMKFPRFAVFMGTAKGVEPFGDLQGFLAVGDCRKIPIAQIVGGACDPWNRPWCYGVWLIHVIQFLHLSNRFYLILGWLNAILISACLGTLAKFYSSNFTWAYLAAFSPPIFFLAERGNTDSLIMFLTVILVFAVIKKKGFWFFWIPALLMGSKIYPGGIIIIFTKMKDFLWALGMTFIFAFIWIKDIHIILGNQPHCRAWSYGDIFYYSQEWRCYSNGVISSKVTIELAIVSLLFWTSSFMVFKLFKPKLLVRYSSFLGSNYSAQVLIKASGIIFLVSFLGVTVVDYKLWTLVILSFGVANLDFGNNKILRLGILGFIFFGLWGSRVTPEWIQYYSNWDLILLSFLVFIYLTQDSLERLKPVILKFRLNRN